MMLRGLQTAMGNTIVHELPALSDLGVQLIRTDCMALSADDLLLRVEEITQAGLVAYPVVRSIDQLTLLPSSTNVELRNEPDLNGPQARDYAALVDQFAPVCAERGLTFWAGCVSNFNKRGFAYLKDAGVQQWPENVNVSIHWYPHRQSPHDPHPGYKSREHEIETLKKLIGNRRWGVSEFGYDQRQPDAAEKVSFEWDFWEQHGADFAVLYQLVDGLSDNLLDHYGIRNLADGSWKPSAHTFKRTT